MTRRLGLSWQLSSARSNDPMVLKMARVSLAETFDILAHRLGGEKHLFYNARHLSPQRLKLLVALSAFITPPQSFAVYNDLAKPMHHCPGLGCPKSACAALLMMIVSDKAHHCPTCERPARSFGRVSQMCGAAEYHPYTEQWREAKELADAYKTHCICSHDVPHPEALLVPARLDPSAVNYFDRLLA